VTELQGHLRQVEEAINHFRDQVKQRLVGLDAKVEEMVRRTWRHVDGGAGAGAGAAEAFPGTAAWGEASSFQD